MCTTELPAMNKDAPHLFVLCGASGTGKTTLCRDTAALLKASGAKVAGILSPPEFTEGRKTGILVQDIRTGEQRRLAEPALSKEASAGLGWRFDLSSLKWGTDILRASTPCEVLMVDELGPLELKQNKGWTVAWEILEARKFHTALVVVRPSLLEPLKERLRGHEIEILHATPGLPNAPFLSKLLLSHVTQDNP